MLSRRILSNTGYNLGAMFINSLIALVLVPVLILNLGEEMFGIWALAGIMITVGAMLDFGLSRALIRTVARQRASGGWSVISLDFNSSLWPLLISTGLITALGIILAPNLSVALGVPTALQPVGTAVLRILCLSFIPVVVSLLLAATLEGAQQMAYTGGALVLNRMVFAAGAIAVVLFDGSVIGVAAAQFVAVCAQMLVLLVAALRVTPSLRFSPRLARRERLRNDIRFGRYIFLTSLVALVFTATNKVVIAHWLGLQNVAYYELASLVALQIFTIGLAAAQALYPAYAAAQIEGGMEAIRRLYSSALRLGVVAYAPVGAAVVALAAPFVQAWFGASAAESAIAMRWLAAGWTVVGIAAAASVGLQAIGRPNWSALFSTYNAIVNLILAVLLVPLWGFWGIIAANVAAISSSALVTLLYFRAHCGLGVRQWLTAMSPRVILWIIAVTLLFVWLGGRLAAPQLWQVVILGLGFFACYGCGLLVLGLLRPDEMARLRAGVGRRFYRGALSP
ncbi:MAG: oligosaccharide flippase family protein [Caldilineales bacterium]|nr:oligosaccharide flippase family protein [Caldilineales bacterium]